MKKVDLVELIGKEDSFRVLMDKVLVQSLYFPNPRRYTETKFLRKLEELDDFLGGDVLEWFWDDFYTDRKYLVVSGSLPDYPFCQDLRSYWEFGLASIKFLDGTVYDVREGIPDDLKKWKERLTPINMVSNGKVLKGYIGKFREHDIVAKGVPPFQVYGSWGMYHVHPGWWVVRKGTTVYVDPPETDEPVYVG